MFETFAPLRSGEEGPTIRSPCRFPLGFQQKLEMMLACYAVLVTLLEIWSYRLHPG